MADKGVDIVERESVAREKGLGHSAQFAAHESRDVAREECLEAFLFNLPAHDVERMGPGVLTGRAKSGPNTTSGQDRTGSTIAEQRRRHDVALGKIVLAEAQRTEFDDEEEDVARRRHPGEGAGARQPKDAAGTTETENRQAPNVAAPSKPLHQQRIQ